MALPRLDYRSVTSLPAATAALAAAGSRGAVLAGGTDLLGSLKDRIHAAPAEVLIDITPIAGLAGIEVDESGASIGALATLAAVASDPGLRRYYPLLTEAARSVASPQIRNQGTVGGNLCQQPRCWYYRHPDDSFHCLRKGGERCAALLGDHRFHSIFGAVRSARPACASTCPGHVEIPLYLESVRLGDMTAAARTILAHNPMPAVTGRVCPHTCESGCNRRDLDDALSIRAIERHLGDYVLDHAAALLPPPAVEQQERIAIVGAGPAGLAAAYYLRTAGFQVTVFERMPRAGGMLAYAIPPYRLPQHVVRRQIEAYRQMGIEFRTGTTIGRRGATLGSLRKQFSAVFLASGAWRAKTLNLPQAELMQSGLELLCGVQSGQAVAVRERVVVIGGGNVALDVALTARRLGAREVTVVCLEARDTMPAFPEDIEQALREGIRLLPGWGPQRVVAAGGTVQGIELVRCSSVFDPQGNFRPLFDPSVTETLPADQILLAIGQATDLAYAGRALRTANGLVVVDPENGATNLAGVFAGGEVCSGPASVIEAIAAGRRAALAIAARVAGPGAPPPDEQGPVPRVTVNLQALVRSARACVVETPPASRTLLGEDVATLGAAAVRQEAQRCVNCGCIAVNASDLAPALMALGATFRTTTRRVPAAEFFDTRPRRTTVLAPSELLLAIELPPPPRQPRQSYLKFRLRHAIDFPIASVAGVLEVEGGQIRSARVAFGAVAPVPLRAHGVEAFLVGRSPSEETAYAAGEIAGRDACVLAGNRYKLQVLKALLRRLVVSAADA